ncbi:MAG: hypothetical protein ABSA45_08565 [Verrucomicrobiota bacterium]|jgi:DNA-directed RNA polymerase subunit RPC12/RpoP
MSIWKKVFGATSQSDRSLPPAMFKFKCPSCQADLTGKDDLRGQSVQCPFCRKTIIVPFSRPEVIRKTKTQVQASRVVGLAALLSKKAELAHGTEDLGLSLAGDWDRYYHDVNPGLHVSIAPSDILTLFVPPKDDPTEVLGAFLLSEAAHRFGRTSKVVQVGLLSTIRPEGIVVRLPVTFVTFVRIGQQELETVEILDLVKGSIQFI